MTIVDGQLSIFDELGEQEPGVTCPHCRHTWTLTKSGEPNLADHIKGSGRWPYGGSIAGKCEGQSISLYQLGAQQHFGLQLRDDEPNTTYNTDLLGAILRAKHHGCTDKQIRKTLTTAKKGR